MWSRCIFFFNCNSIPWCLTGMARCKSSHVIWRRNWRRLSWFFFFLLNFIYLFVYFNSAEHRRQTDRCSPWTQCTASWGASGGEGKGNVLLGCCVDGMRSGFAAAAAATALIVAYRRPVRTGRATLRGLFDVWERCRQMQLRSSVSSDDFMAGSKSFKAWFSDRLGGM